VSAAEVDDALSALCARELLQATDRDGYRFWHPLTQEVAAGTLLAERRCAIHAAVARALIDAEPGRHDENAALIATHWEAAGDRWEAAQWNARAADRAYRHDLAESIRRWRTTMTHLGTVDHDDALRLGVRARSRLVRFGSRTGMDDDELAQLLEEGRSLADRVDDPRVAMDMTNAAGTALAWRGHVADGLEEFRRAGIMVESFGPAESWAFAPLVGMTGILRWTGPTTAGLDYAERLVRFSGGDPQVGSSLFGFGFLGAALMCQAELLRLAGDGAAARACAGEATRVLREQSELEWLGWSLSLAADLAETADESEAALAHATEALRIADDTANPANRVIALRAQGVSLNGLGRFDHATEVLEQGLAVARARKVALFEEGVLLTHLALAHLGAGRFAEAAAAADEAVDIARRQGAAIVECHAHLVRARIGRASGAPPDQVAGDVAAGLDLVAQTGAVVYEAGLRELA
jgi:adenylate cyclase